MSDPGEFLTEDINFEEHFKEDYYSYLNISHEATDEEINQAYRKLSRLYHPDKHVNSANKKEAELMFYKIKNAYEVLSDPHKRAIYDTVGIKGLKTDGWEVVQRTKTPQEIRDEYERLAREEEERRLQQRTNPKGSINVTVNATDLFESYDEDYEERRFPQLEINNMSISQSIEAPLTTTDTLTLAGNLNSQNGNGSGSVSCSLRRILSSKSWAEFDIGAGSGLICSVKGFRTLSQHSFVNMSGIFQFTPHGISPGLQAVLARQLDKRTVGYLTWKTGVQSSMNSMIVWDSIRGHFIAALQLGIRTSYVMASYAHKFPEEKGKIKGSLKFGTFGLVIEYGCEKKISSNSIIGATMAIGIPNGVTLKVKVNRANQNYVFPILLSEELLPTSVFYGTIAPLLAWYTINALIIQPHLKKQQLKESERVKAANASKIAKKKAEAESAVALMQETVKRMREQEEARQGLIIIQALYGKLVQDDAKNMTQNSEIIDVTVPLQCLVNNSRILLYESTKSNILGFYDPCYGENKSLYVLYKFHNETHEVTIEDSEPLKIPQRSHRVKS